MGVLTDTDGRKRTRRKPSTVPGGSVPSSLPNSDILNDIESLKAQIGELQKDKDAHKQELADLKAQLADAKALLAEKTTPDQTPNENHKPGFFGY